MKSYSSSTDPSRDDPYPCGSVQGFLSTTTNFLATHDIQRIIDEVITVEKEGKLILILIIIIQEQVPLVSVCLSVSKLAGSAGGSPVEPDRWQSLPDGLGHIHRVISPGVLIGVIGTVIVDWSPLFLLSYRGGTFRLSQDNPKTYRVRTSCALFCQ